MIIILVLVLLALSAFFSSAETALTTANRMHIRALADEGKKRALILMKIFDNSSKMLSAILIGNNIVNIAASSLMTIAAQEYFGNYAVSIATGLLTVLVLIFGEITPKTLATIYAESLALNYSYFIYWLMIILTPVIYIINLLSLGVMKLFRIDVNKKSAVITENDLRTIVDVSHEEGVIESDEREMIKNVFDFGDAKARDVMVPRIDMCTVDVNSTYEELLRIFKENKYTRFPVYSGSTDNITGIINIKDILLYKSGEDFNMKNYLRQPYFTHEQKGLSDLMFEMKKASVNITIVLDEYGAASGLITLEDLIEEIVGEIRDEYDYDEEDEIKKVGDKEFIADGQMSLDDFNKATGSTLSSKDYDSIAGYILEHLERLAAVNDSIEADGIVLTVTETEKNRIEKVHVRKL